MEVLYYMKSGITDYVWRETFSYQLPWNEVKNIYIKEHRRVRNLKVSAHTLGYEDFISRPSMVTHMIWVLLIRKDK